MRKHQRIIILNRDNDDSLGEDDASHPRPENDYHHDAIVFLNLEVVRDQLPMTCCFVPRDSPNIPCCFHFLSNLLFEDNTSKSKWDLNSTRDAIFGSTALKGISHFLTSDTKNPKGQRASFELTPISDDNSFATLWLCRELDIKVVAVGQKIIRNLISSCLVENIGYFHNFALQSLSKLK